MFSDKFNCHWNQSGPVISDEQYEMINYWREILYNMDLIGAYENGVGFGNISMRIRGGNQFVITGSVSGDVHGFTVATKLLSARLINVKPLIQATMPLDKIQDAFELASRPERTYRIELTM